jgi:hypothetical protein
MLGWTMYEHVEWYYCFLRGTMVFFLRKIAPVSEVVLSVWADMVGRVATSTVGCSEVSPSRLGRAGGLQVAAIGSRS